MIRIYVPSGGAVVKSVRALCFGEAATVDTDKEGNRPKKRSRDSKVQKDERKATSTSEETKVLGYGQV